MNRYFKVSTRSYYDYLQKYNSKTLLKYQSLSYFEMGRKSAWKNLVYKYAGDHITTEEDLDNNYKTPIFLANLSHRLAIFFSVYIIYVTCTCLNLSEGQKVFMEAEQDYDDIPDPDDNLSYGYETLYCEKKPVSF